MTLSIIVRRYKSLKTPTMSASASDPNLEVPGKQVGVILFILDHE